MSASRNLTKILDKRPSGDELRRPSGGKIPVTVWQEALIMDDHSQYYSLAKRWGEVQLTNQGGKLYFKYEVNNGTRD